MGNIPIYNTLCKCGNSAHQKNYLVQSLSSKSILMKKILDYSIQKNQILNIKRLDHINILKINNISVFQNINEIILIEEYAKMNLKSYLNQNNILNLNLIKSYFYQLLSGIYFFHKNNIIHGNLKLKNIFIFPDGLIKISNSKIDIINKNHKEFNDILKIIFIIIRYLFLNNKNLFKEFKQRFLQNNDWKNFLKNHLSNNINDSFLNLLDLILNNQISAFEALHHLYFDDILIRTKDE